MEKIQLTPVQKDIAAQFLVQQGGACVVLDGDLLLLPADKSFEAVARLEQALQTIRIPKDRLSGEASQAFTRYWAIRRLRHKILQHSRQGIQRRSPAPLAGVQ